MRTVRLLFIATCLVASTSIFSQINSNLQTPLSINTDGSDADTTSMLHVQSTNKGMLTPRMTTAQRTAIASPANGLLVYDTVTKSFWYYDNDVWNEIPTAMAAPGEDGENAPGLAIVDGDPIGVLDTITLSQPGVINSTTQIRVCVNITHPFVADIDISLTGPDGTTIDLSSDNGGGGDHYTDACFSTAANTSITAGSAPFTGNWMPEQPFSNFYTKPIAGPWVLKVVDDNAIIDNGTFDSWSIEITPRAAAANLLSDKDGDTKIQVEKSPDEDKIRFDVAGAEAFLLDNNRNAFLNNGKSLFVGGETSLGNDGLRMHHINENSYIDHKGMGRLHFRVDNGLGNSTRMVIDTLGNVGIGTVNPQANLSIFPFGSGAKITLYDEGSPTNHHGFGVSAGQTNYHVPLAGNDHVFYAGGKNGDGTELMRIKGNGNVGIGFNPAAPLMVKASSNISPINNGFHLYNNVNTADEHAIISARVAGPSGGNPFLSLDIAGESGWAMGIDNNDGNKLKFANTWNNLAANTRMTIQTNGDVGIGLNNPTEKLHVNGNIRVANDASIFGLDQLVGFNDLRFSGDATGGTDMLINPDGTVRIFNRTSINHAYNNVTLNVRGEASGDYPFTVEKSDGTFYFEIQPDGNSWTHKDVLAGGFKLFMIDHPLDPANKKLGHIAIEGPDAYTFYQGKTTLDGKGEAWVELPAYFEVLNKDFLYQLTCIGGYAQVYIAEEISGNKFKIGGGTPGLKVSWQVTATRNDPYARENRKPAEQAKTGDEAGTYFYPKGYGMGTEKSYGRNRE